MRSIFLILFSIFLGHSPLLAQDRAVLQTELDKLVYLDAQIDFERTPGFIVGVIWGDSTFFYSYGSALQDSTLLLDSTSIFEIAELGHIFLGELTFQELENGTLQLEQEPACGAFDSLGLSVVDLLTHYSGLPRFILEFGDVPQETSDPYAGIDEETLFSRSIRGDLPENEYSFSNLNYAILGQCLAASDTFFYHELVDTKVWRPLGMNFSGFTELDSVLVTGFNKTKEPTSPWSYSAMEPAVGVRSSSIDITRFIRHLLDQGRFDILRDNERPTGIRDNTSVTWGWHILQMKKYYPIFVQSGATSGYRAYAAVVPETQTGVVVLSNSPYGLNGLGFMILRMLNNYWKK